ncbi:SH3 domain-containing protein [Chloroflexales bacterium ZM16-3]|nr:SH3 domain-containing protein [Chloroflexales bacterium ZM16-3]
MRRMSALVPLLAAILVGCADSGGAVGSPTSPPIIPVAEAATLPTSTPVPPTATSVLPTFTPVPTSTPVPPTATPAGPTVVPTPSPRPAGTAPRVGLQAGHLNASELPDELARFRTSTGARYGGVSEADLNYDIAQRVQALLEAEGVIVDLLPATIPPSYDADAFIAIHADGSAASGPRGWKLATPWRASRAAQQLLDAVAASYGPATGLPQDVGGVTVNMRGYYAFNDRRHTHAIARTTPAIIVEMGFMTSAADRAVLFDQPGRVASGIAQGVLAYLAQRDPSDGAALLPPDFPNLRVGEAGAILRSAPSDDARQITRIAAGQRLFALDRRDGWYQVFSRDFPSAPGWIREDLLETTSEAFPFPTTTNP